MGKLSEKLTRDDVIVPCSSGGAFTVTMQAFIPKFGQIIVSNKGLASMGYGLAGAIGAAESTQSRTVLIEGDGSFAQNLQELGTLATQKLNVKIFLFSNSGYASIRMTQLNYFDGAYLGCDLETGLGLPDWSLIAKAYGIRYTELDKSSSVDSILEEVLGSKNPEFIEVKIDPEQTYYPKITSRILPTGAMTSNPLHLMTPDLSSSQIELYLPYLRDRIHK
jgi:acetolactate synthase-1/2/3 large subunit